uniref:Squalene cyclase C-terminal domain-containing protein n=1 Tax=Fagus sylvatica TaxID=28930 RepID=A0A2N9G8N6_FAGSY
MLLCTMSLTDWELSVRHYAGAKTCAGSAAPRIVHGAWLRKENPCGPIPPPVKVKETEVVTEEAVITTLRRALSFYSSIQAHDGHWPAESAGPLFFLQPIVMALYITGDLNAMFSPAHQKEIIRYLYNHQVLGVYEWSGCNPLPPEFWLLPNIFPIHPAVSLVHVSDTQGFHYTKYRQNVKLQSIGVYMPMSYLYGKRFVGPITGLVQSLRQELYNEPYHQINWNNARSTVAKEDLYYPHPLVQDMLWGVLHHVAEPILTCWPFSMLREKPLKAAIGHVRYEDENSQYLCIGSIEKVLCLIARWVEDPNSEAYKRHLARLPDNYWVAEDGLKIQSFGCQMWDAGFAIQAILSCNLNEEFGPTLRKSHDFVKASQVWQNPSDDFKAMYRHISKGAWTFSMQDHGWQVSDCTAEGLKVAILFSQMSPDLVGEKMETERFYDAVNVILSLQSSNGGFPAWEPQRAYRWLEKFNSSEFFEDALIEREYVECTSSAVQGLALFRKFYPKHRRTEIDSSISKAIQYIEDVQEPDGSW